MQVEFDLKLQNKDETEKFKAQGMYPTPTPLAQRALLEIFSRMRTIPGALLEPSAGYGAYVIEAWNYWKRRLGNDNKKLNQLINNTYCFENDRNTFNQLQINLQNWCTLNKVKAKPQLIFKNFLLDHTKTTHSFPNSTVVIGNPPWDEFTTRKHDNTELESVKLIRVERQLEYTKYRTLGYKNLYQAFLHEILRIPVIDLRISFILPRQILGDRSAVSLREKLLSSGTLKVTSYRNKDEPDYCFPEVDANFEIIILDFHRDSQKHGSKPVAFVRRGFAAKCCKMEITEEDLTIPCPHSEITTEVLMKIIEADSLAKWADDSEIRIQMGKIKCSDVDYQKAMNGKSYRAYDRDMAKSTLLVANKILPNSKRKLKVAEVPSSRRIAESLVTIECKNSEFLPYLLLMLNSKPIEIALHALRSNINLNIFRLLSLPIPKPDSATIKLAQKLINDAENGRISFDKASEKLTSKVFSLSNRDNYSLNEILPDHIPQTILKKVA